MRERRIPLVIRRVSLPVVQQPRAEEVTRPLTRLECENAPRPCPYVSCEFHLYLEVMPDGDIRLNFPHIEPDELEKLPATCVLDVAARGGVGPEEAGSYLNLTDERARQITNEAQAKAEAEIRKRRIG